MLRLWILIAWWLLANVICMRVYGRRVSYKSLLRIGRIKTEKKTKTKTVICIGYLAFLYVNVVLLLLQIHLSCRMSTAS